jgi:hypothetical protein
MSWPKTEQEEKLDEIYNELDSGFRKLDKLKDPTKSNAILKDLTNKLKDAKTCGTRQSNMLAPLAHPLSRAHVLEQLPSLLGHARPCR